MDPHFFIVEAEAPLGGCRGDAGVDVRDENDELSITWDFGRSNVPVVRLFVGLVNGRDGRILLCAAVEKKEIIEKLTKVTKQA